MCDIITLNNYTVAIDGHIYVTEATCKATLKPMLM